MIPVWDMDGTLLDSTEVVPAAFVRAVAALGGPPVTAPQVVGSYWRGTNEVILSHLMGRELTDVEQQAYFRELDGVSVPVYPGIVETLGQLRADGLPIVVFTGASTRSARILLAAAGLEPDLLIGGDQVARPKPAPDGVLLAAQRLGTTPDQLIMVGDSPLDLRSARAAGARGAAAAWGHMYDPAAPADVTLASPGELMPVIRCRPAAGAPDTGRMTESRTIRVTVRGSFDNLTDEQKAELTANGGDDLLTVQYTEQGHITYDIAARPFFTFRFAEQVDDEKDIPQAAIRAEMKAVAWLEDRGYGYKKITSQTVDMSEVPLGKRGKREAAKS